LIVVLISALFRQLVLCGNRKLDRPLDLIVLVRLELPSPDSPDELGLDRSPRVMKDHHGSQKIGMLDHRQ
jgi:hypothetical protein